MPPDRSQSAAAARSACAVMLSCRRAAALMHVTRSGPPTHAQSRKKLTSRNPAAVVRLPAPRSRKRRWRTVDEARRFLESTRRHNEPLYAAFVLILVLGLRKGEVLGLTWDLADVDTGELYVSEQVQRVGHELLRRQVKTETSEAPLPLPELCVAALKLRAEQQQRDRDRADGAWIDTGLVYTTRGMALPSRRGSPSAEPSWPAARESRSA